MAVAAMGGVALLRSGSPGRSTDLDLPGAIPGTLTTVLLPGPHAWANGLALDRDGAVWVSNQGLGGLGRIGHDGAFDQRPLPPTLPRSDSIVLGSDGDLWFFESGTNKVGRMTPAGVVTEFSIPTQFSGPMGTMTVAQDGTIWFSEREVGRVARVRADGQISEMPLPDPKALPVGTAAAPDGSVWVVETNARRLARISPRQELTEYVVAAGDDSLGNWLALDGSGNVWYSLFNTRTGGSRIVRRSPTGKLKEFSLPTQGAQVSGMAVDGHGTFWFSQWNVDELGRITKDGRLSVLHVPSPGNMIAAPDGSLWFIANEGNSVARIKPD